MKGVPLELMLTGAGVGERHHHCRFDNYDASTQEMAKARDTLQVFAAEWPQPVRGKSLVLSGLPGTGKTHLCTAVIAQMLNGRTSVVFCTMARLLRRVKGTWASGAKKTEAEAIADLISPRLLVIDEFITASQYERDLIAEIINERYSARRPVIIATNVPAPSLAEHLPARSIDRLREDGGVVIQFTWESHRGKIAT